MKGKLSWLVQRNYLVSGALVCALSLLLAIKISGKLPPSVFVGAVLFLFLYAVALFISGLLEVYDGIWKGNPYSHWAYVFSFNCMCGFALLILTVGHSFMLFQ